jgi:hypothetical protein
LVHFRKKEGREGKEGKEGKERIGRIELLESMLEEEPHIPLNSIGKPSIFPNSSEELYWNPQKIPIMRPNTRYWKKLKHDLDIVDICVFISI